MSAQEEAVRGTLGKLKTLDDTQLKYPTGGGGSTTNAPPNCGGGFMSGRKEREH